MIKLNLVQKDRVTVSPLQSASPLRRREEDTESVGSLSDTVSTYEEESYAGSKAKKANLQPYSGSISNITK